MSLAFITAADTFAVTAQPVVPNVLLITIDTTRADRLGAYGYLGARTPILDGLARAGVRFTDATAHAPLTHPSHAAILTGVLPSALGIRLNGMDPVPDGTVTLAERMKARGYRTAAIVGSAILNRAQGMAQGFEHYDDEFDMPNGDAVVVARLQRDAAAVSKRAGAWVKEQRAPWFLWAHFYDPHLPYEAPATTGVKDPYDAEIAHVDREIGRLLATIDRARTLIVVTADHGESLGEHGEDDHGYFLYDATLRVPLIVAGPGLQPRVITNQVRSIDIAPTILDLVGGEWQRTAVSGESLRTLLDGGTRPEDPVSIAESWYPRLHFGWSELRSARVGEWKFIAAPRPELYDLRTDKGERLSVIAERAQVAARLSAELQRATPTQTQRTAVPSAQPDTETVRRLQALGYVGSFAPVTSTTGADDPKDRLADYRSYRDLFNRALDLLGRGRAAEAVPLLLRLVKTNVRAFEAHLYLGNAYLQQKKLQAALGEYDVAAMLNPEIATPHFEAGKALSLMDRSTEAAARLDRGLALDPQSAYGLYTLGVVQQRAGRWEDARTAFRRAVDLNARDPRARAGLAAAAMRLKDLDTAKTQFEAMVDLGYQVAPAQFNLGVIAAMRGDTAEAARRYKLSLRADPSFKPAQDALAKMR